MGIGNILWSDEGFGTHLLEILHQGYELADNITLVDGGTQGMFLLPLICDCDALIILDAIDFGLKGGELKLISGEDVPQYMGAKKISMHQTGFQEVLAAARMMNNFPAEIALVGVQPVSLEYGGDLSDEVKKAIPECLLIIKKLLLQWGAQIHEINAEFSTACDNNNQQHETLIPSPLAGMHNDY